MKCKVLSSKIRIGKYEKNIGFLFLKSLKKYNNKRFFFYLKDNEWISKSYLDIFEDASKIAYHLKKEGFLEKNKRAITLSSNSYNMLIWELALLFSGIASVSVWNEAKEEMLFEVIKNSKPSFAFVDSIEKERMIKKFFDMKIYKIKEIEKIKESNSNEEFLLDLIEKVEPETEAFIQFTSGSTGEMKGVVLTHKNITSQQRAFSLIWKIPPSSIFLSYLPWYHSYGGLFERFIAINYGVLWYLDPEIGKDIDKLFYQWEKIKPTHFFSVPKVYIEILKKLEESKKIRKLFFHKNLKTLFTAGAPFPLKCSKFFEKKGVVIMEGWGLTETSPTVTLTSPKGGRKHSYVGFPIPGCKVKVNKEGEIYVKGLNVMKGYLDEEKTREVLCNGWLKTGDIGEITKEGLRLICRNDGIFKLSNGKKVASLPIEEKLTFISKEIQNVILFGNGMEKVGALIFVNQNADIRNLKEEIIRNSNKWKPEKIPFYGFALIQKSLSIEKNEITPTQKVVRKKVLENYKEFVEALCLKNKSEKLEKFIFRL